MIATKKTSEYDRAVDLLLDLRALAGRCGEEAAFAAVQAGRRRQSASCSGVGSAVCSRIDASIVCTTRIASNRSFSSSDRSSWAWYELANSVSPPVAATSWALSIVAMIGTSSVHPSMCQWNVPLR